MIDGNLYPLLGLTNAFANEKSDCNYFRKAHGPMPSVERRKNGNSLSLRVSWQRWWWYGACVSAFLRTSSLLLFSSTSLPSCPLLSLSLFPFVSVCLQSMQLYTHVFPHDASIRFAKPFSGSEFSHNRDTCVSF